MTKTNLIHENGFKEDNDNDNNNNSDSDSDSVTVTVTVWQCDNDSVDSDSVTVTVTLIVTVTVGYTSSSIVWQEPVCVYLYLFVNNDCPVYKPSATYNTQLSTLTTLGV